MPAVNRRTACAAFGALTLSLPGRSAAESPIRGAWPFLSTGKEIPVNVASHAVRWKEHDYRLVRIGSARFSLSTLGRLTGVLDASVTTFDSVDYEVHAALFDAAGKLLGTASTVCPVERVWLGKVLTSRAELRLDFGVSTAYGRGEWFTLGITERRVLTPDDWMK